MDMHIVVLESGILLVKRAGADWRAFKDAFSGYVTSVGPCTLAEACEWIELERPDIHAAQAAAIAAVAAGPADVLKLT